MARGKRVIVLAAFSALLAACNNVGPAGSHPPPPAPYPDVERCYTAPTPPAGYIRIGSKPGLLAGCTQTDPTQLNILVFTRYDNQPVGKQLLVCADQAVPTGWIDVSGSYHDAKGCDYQAHPDPTFANVRLIYRQN
jgi:hypothetical protein